MTPADRWTHADDSPASRDREEGREAARYERYDARPVNDPTPAPGPWEFEEWEV